MGDFKTVGEAWASYRAIVVPDDASHSQLKQTKGAFYMGFNTAMAVISDIGVNRTDDEINAIFDGLYNEIEVYVNQVRNSG